MQASRRGHAQGRVAMALTKGAGSAMALTKGGRVKERASLDDQSAAQREPVAGLPANRAPADRALERQLDEDVLVLEAPPQHPCVDVGNRREQAGELSPKRAVTNAGGHERLDQAHLRVHACHEVLGEVTVAGVPPALGEPRDRSAARASAAASTGRLNRLAERLAAVERTPDAVRDLMALGAGYVANALANPHLYRAMFDTEADLEDPEVAAAGFGELVACAVRARDTGRFASSCDPEAVATQLWATGHGLTMLALTGVLPSEALAAHAPAIATALFVAAGDAEERCRRSVESGWSFDADELNP